MFPRIKKTNKQKKKHSLSLQLQRWLVGGLRIVGICGSGGGGGGDKASLKVSMADCFSPPQTYGGRQVFLLQNGPTALLTRFDVPANGVWAQEGVIVQFSVVTGLFDSAFTLSGTRLAIHMDVSSKMQPLGVAIEKAAALLADRIRSDVVVAVRQQPDMGNTVDIWTRGDGIVAHRVQEPESAILMASGVVSGFVYAHRECPPETVNAFLIEDLALASVVTRVDVMLDELDAIEEDFKEQSRREPHLLKRDNAASSLSVVRDTVRWTLPRRVLVLQAGVSVPFCDWQMPGEYAGEDTLLRYRETIGLTGARLDASREEVPNEAQLTLSGEKSRVPYSKSIISESPARIDSRDVLARKGAPSTTAISSPGGPQPILFIYLGMIGLLVAIIAWKFLGK